MDGHGATLIEALVVMVLLGVIAAAAFGLYSTGHTAARLAASMEQASLLAQQRLEQVKAAAACDTTSINQPRELVDSVNFPGFTWEVEAREDAPGLQQVTVTVSWRQVGRDRQVNLTTYIRSQTEKP